MALKHEVGLNVDDFGNQEILSYKNSIAQLVMNVLFMKPGSLPGLPHIGVDINSYLFTPEGDSRLGDLQNNLMAQIEELLPYITIGKISIVSTEVKGTQMLLVTIPITYDSTEDLLIVGISPTSGATLTHTSPVNVVYQFGELLNN